MPELFEGIVGNASDGLGVGDAGGAGRGAGGEGQVDDGAPKAVIASFDCG